MELTLPTVPSLPLVVFALPVVFYVLYALSWRARSRGRSLPPGPQRLPVVGNLFNMPKVHPWLAYRDLCSKYGDILHFRILGHSIVILGSAELMTQYLDKRSANTSDRKQTPLIELTGGGLNFGHLPYGPWWRRHRRAFWQHFSSSAVAQYESHQRAMAQKLVGDILRDPLRLPQHLQFNFNATLMKLLYNIDVNGDNDKHLAIVNAALSGAPQGGVPGKFLIRHFPFLRYIPDFLPGAGFQKQFARWQAAANALKNVPFEHVKAFMEHDGQESIIGRLLDALAARSGQLSVAEEEEVIKNVGAISFDAGADTTISTLQAALLALCLFPDVLRKVQMELDAVVGPNRLPDFSDSSELVYLNAVIKETFRWFNVVPLGVPHCTTADDELNGFFIPKGTVLIPNVWACMHDPEVYENPHEFRPERFIKDGQLDAGTRDPYEYVFGFGRRICPGRHYAEGVVFINLASILHVFDVSAPRARNDQPIVHEMRASDGYLLYPERCLFTIKPRSTEAESLIMG
ncbi:cytochrome P450 [Lentinus brumalis]|uniref:Cytochrome P450 n=1 Tax=Lentinus brumalis TaxID=2498619 RepID=A0A371CZW1_9APHY|nr:cytochrome P450 [Polyporus brumalis]